ncbi:MAG: hypothetical protein M3139_14030 [Bacteroidota bacterium]|nr:hypothetical protein [Bacteroidota bacterium]
MLKNITKKIVLDACMQKQEELVESFETRVNMMTSDTYDQNQSASQSEDRTAGKVDLLNTIKSELAFARQELEYLKTLDANAANTRVEPGALVLTDGMNFFIGVSSEKIEIDDEVIYGISTNAPIYKPMEGLQNGDSFKYNDSAYKIKSIA